MRPFILAVVLLFACGTAWASPGEVAIKTVAMEASNQGAYGQFLVASVIVNRATERGQTLEQVCLAPKQFSAWNDRKWAKAWLKRYYDKATRKKAMTTLSLALKNPYPNIDHYCTVETYPYWAENSKPIITHGGHKFFDLQG